MKKRPTSTFKNIEAKQIQGDQVIIKSMNLKLEKRSPIVEMSCSISRLENLTVE